MTSACGGQHQLSGEITSIVVESPNFPNPANVHTQCVWVITGPAGKTLSAVYDPVFDLPGRYRYCYLRLLEAD